MHNNKVFNGFAVAIGMAGLMAGTFALASEIHTHGYARFANVFLTHSRSTPQNKIDLLFIEQARQGSLLPSQKKPGCDRLTLQHLPLGLHYFTDQPKRMAGKLTTAEFMRVWHHQNKAPSWFIPNVAIQGVAFDAQHKLYEFNEVAALSDPNYNVKQDEISYLACPLKGNKMVSIKHLQDVTVFFDNFSQWPP